MLAVLLVEMEWTKENRTPQGAIRRQEYYKPRRVEDGVELTGDGIFYKRCKYYQSGESIFSAEEASDKLEKKLEEESAGKAFAGGDEWEQRFAVKRNNAVRRDKGSFYTLEKIDIPCITISKEQENCYRIMWFDDGQGMPRRRGGNENFGKKGEKFAGQPNRLNETAFILEEGQAGLLKYNYRHASYHGQWYKCYYVYIVNERVLTQDIFLRTYDYEYNQLADLF